MRGRRSRHIDAEHAVGPPLRGCAQRAPDPTPEPVPSSLSEISGPTSLTSLDRMGAAASHDTLLGLQRTVGNGAIRRLVRPSTPPEIRRFEAEEEEPVAGGDAETVPAAAEAASESFASGEAAPAEPTAAEGEPAAAGPIEAEESTAAASEEEAEPVSAESTAEGEESPAESSGEGEAASDGGAAEGETTGESTEAAEGEAGPDAQDAERPEREEPGGDIPLNMIRQDVDRFPQIGLGVTDVPDGHGVTVSEIESDHPGLALLHEGDLLVTVDTLQLSSAQVLREVLAAKEPGDFVVLGFVAGGLNGIPVLGGQAEAAGGGGAASGDISLQRTPDIQRQPAPTGVTTVQVQQGGQPPPPPPPQVNVRDWPSKLTFATRGPGQGVTKVLNKLELKNTELGVDTPLTPEQKAIIDKIKDNRAKIPISDKLKAREQQGRKEADSKAGFQYGGAGPKAKNPETEEKRKKVWEAIATEIGSGEGHISAVNTFDDAIVSLGGGFAHGQLSAMMQDFFAHDKEAEEMFLDVGVSFTGGRLLIVNTDNGGIEADALGAKDMTFNARKIMSMSLPILSLYIQIAETEKHGQILAASQLAQTQGFKFPQRIPNEWTDMLSVRLVAHLIHFRGSLSWADFVNTGGGVKAIMKVFAEKGHTAERDPAKGNAFVVGGTVTTVIFAMAQGHAKTGLASQTSEALPAEIAPNSLSGVLLMTDPKDSSKFFKLPF